MDINFRKSKCGQLCWLACTKLQIIENNVAMEERCYHWGSSRRLVRGCLSSLCHPSGWFFSCSGSGSSSPAVPCTHDSFQQKKRDNFSPDLLFSKKNLFWAVLPLSLVRTRCVLCLLHWDYPDYLCLVWIYSWARASIPFHKHVVIQRRVLSRQWENIQNTHIFLFYLWSQNTMEMSYLCISTHIPKKWKQ